MAWKTRRTFKFDGVDYVLLATDELKGVSVKTSANDDVSIPLEEFDRLHRDLVAVGALRESKEQVKALTAIRHLLRDLQVSPGQELQALNIIGILDNAIKQLQ